VLDLRLDQESLKPLIAEIVRIVVAELEQIKAALPDGRLAFSEPEAAALLGLRTHQLRDERIRGRIGAAVGPGKKLLYQRQDLLTYLQSRRWGQKVGDQKQEVGRGGR
jgi:hypothetical protein